MGIDPVGVNESNIHSFNRYAYANNNPYKYVDPDGRAVETVWDVANLAMGVASFGANLNAGNYAGAGLDAAGIIVDAVATAIPVVPGGAGATIKAYRAADTITTSKRAAQLAENVKNGKAAEAQARQDLINEGYEIIGSQVTIKTADGKVRYVDHLVKKDGQLTAIEVKSGNARRSNSQLSKDNSIETQGGTIGNRGGDYQDQTLRIKTEERRY